MFRCPNLWQPEVQVLDHVLNKSHMTVEFVPGWESLLMSMTDMLPYLPKTPIRKATES
jgi:hypothetical protein